MIEYPKELDKIFNKLQNFSSKIIIVGGFVRDSLLGIKSKDIDIEVYGVKSFEKLENILKEFGDVNNVGKSFGICKLHFQNYELDFSLPRSDNKIKSGHRGFDISINPNLNFKTATSRRDFTINSIGYDIKEKKLLDPFNGINDLKNKILKMVNKSHFIEDPLRVLRAAGFCARFELNIDNELLSLCQNMVSKNMLNELPKERIFSEIKKIFLKAKKPSIGFELLKKFGSNIYNENIYILDNIKLTTNSKTNIILMLSALCYNYEINKAINFIKKLTDEKDILKRVLPLIQNHQKININLSNYELYKLATKIKLEELLILCQAIYGDKMYKTINTIKERAIKLNILNKKLTPLLKGEDILKLGLKPSVEFSKILNNAYEAQMKGEFSNYLKAKNWLKNYLASRF